MFVRLKRAVLLLAAYTLASPAWAQEVYSDNVVIVLDASGSMRKTMRGTGMQKMDAAKAALKEVLQRVPGNTNIGLLVFSARNVENDWVYPLGPREDALLMAAVDLPEPGGGTPLGRYMKIAADRLLEERQKQFGYGTYRLLIVTDGQASDTQRVEAFTPEIMARGITVDVIGVDMRDRHTLATKAHSYRSADDPDSLKKAVQDVFAEIGSASGTDADEDAFAVIANVPFEVAEGMVSALATSGNDPIGERAAASRGAPQSPPQRAPIERQQPSGGTSQPAPQDDDSGGFAVWQIALLAVIVIIAISRGNRRSRRRRR